MIDPVLIVGAGPTGLTAALELSRFGVPARLIDKAPEAPTTSRAIGVQARTLELLEQRGLAERLVRLGNPGRGGSVYGGGRRVFRLDFSHVPSRYNYMLFVSQAETEEVLREALKQLGGVTERGVEMIGFSQDAFSENDSPVEVILRHPDGRLEQTRTPWLISAEGAHSVVRATLDLPYEGKTFDEQYALGDLHIIRDLSDTDFHIFSSPHGFMGLFPMGSRRFRLIASNPLSKPEKGTGPSLEELQGIYDQRSHIAAQFHDMTWSSWFRINSRMVPRLKIGRLLLGGDSAHIHSPAGAQGMNTGIQDMINLCWKLALVIKGQALPSLLDTYEQDRLPVMRNVLFKTENLTKIIGSENPILRSLFNHFGPFIGGASLIQENSTARISQVTVEYRDSPISADYAHSGDLHAGDRVPDLRVRYRRGGRYVDGRLLDVLDPLRFVLLVAHGDEANMEDVDLFDIAAKWTGTLSLVEVAQPSDNSERAAYEAVLGSGSSVFLIRPDAYVGFAGHLKGAERDLYAYGETWLSSPDQKKAQ